MMFRRIVEFEIVRYIINGLFATAIHYLMLMVNIEIIGIRSAGLSNFIAAFFGIFVSFIGNKYFVFNGCRKLLLNQAIKFGLLYLLIATIHGIVLYIWSDLYRLDYRIGFLVASVVQFILSFSGNKLVVFKS